MSDVYSFRAGPTYRGASRQEMFDAAMEQPLSITSTLMDQAKGGFLESFGAGTALKSLVTPQGETETSLAEPLYGMALVPFPNAYGIVKSGVQSLMDQGKPLDEDAYKASASFRDGIPWDAGMTDTRAAALASFDDAKKVREFYASKRPFASFVGNIGGQALDPINYVPVAGPLVKAAAVGRFGRIAGEALTAGIDAAGNTAVFGIGTAGERAKFGDDVSWQSTVSQIATAALIGGAFGTIAGATGKRVDARLRSEAETRLGTLRTVQESRIALNEGIDALVNGEDVRLSPNATEPMARIAGEVQALGKAYDDVAANPTGPLNDPLVHLTPDDIEGMIVSRGAFRNFNEAEVSKSGLGLVKVIWSHGEKSNKPEAYRVTKGDVVDLPNVIRDFAPVAPDEIRADADTLMRTWKVERDGRVIVYGDKGFDGAQHLVTVHVLRPDAPGAKGPLSEKRIPVATGSSVELLRPVGDTASPPLGFVGEGPVATGNRNIAQRPAIDNTAARPEPAPEGIKQAEASIAKPDDAKALASQYRVDPETGSFHEEADLAQLFAEGRFTEQDAATMLRAQADYEEGASYAEALKSVAACLL